MVKQWIGRRRVAESLPPLLLFVRLPRPYAGANLGGYCARVSRWKPWLASVSSVVELGTFNPKVVGSNPTGSTLEHLFGSSGRCAVSPPLDIKWFLMGQGSSSTLSARQREDGAYRRARPLWVFEVLDC